MDDFIQIEKWKVNRAKVKHSARKMSMANALKIHLSRYSESVGVDPNVYAALQADPQRYETMTEAEREFCDTAQGLGGWVMVASCVEPFITIQEWLEIDEATLDALSRAVQEINPHWFNITAAQEKKTSVTPTESTSASPS